MSLQMFFIAVDAVCLCLSRHINSYRYEFDVLRWTPFILSNFAFTLLQYNSTFWECVYIPCWVSEGDRVIHRGMSSNCRQLLRTVVRCPLITPNDRSREAVLLDDRARGESLGIPASNKPHKTKSWGLACIHHTYQTPTARWLSAPVVLQL